MAKTYTGVVNASIGTVTDPMISVALDHGQRPRRPIPGTRVEVRVLLSDEEIGRRLRVMLTEDVDKRSVRDLATDISDTDGWPILADLIREVIDA